VQRKKPVFAHFSFKSLHASVFMHSAAASATVLLAEMRRAEKTSDAGNGDPKKPRNDKKYDQLYPLLRPAPARGREPERGK